MGFLVIYDCDDNFPLINKQFEKFLPCNDKLPEFKITIQKNDLQFSKKELLQEVNGYNFYKSCGNSFLFSLNGIYLILSKDFKTAKVIYNTYNRDTQNDISNLLMLGYKYRMIRTNNMIIHSAAIVYYRDGILFCGMSGAGKSTQANLWKKNLNVWALNFDQPTIISENGKYFVHGSPWSGKEKKFVNSFARLKAIVFVEQSDENIATKLTPSEAFAMLYLHNYLYPISSEVETEYIQTIKNITENVMIYNLKCQISENAVEALYTEIYKDDYYKAKEKAAMKYVRKKEFELKEIAGDFILVARGANSIDYSAVLVLNEAGAFLWNKLASEKTLNELSGALADEYSIDADLAYNDTVKFLEKMNENKLVDITK